MVNFFISGVANWKTLPEFMLFGMMGAVTVEIIKLYEISNKKSAKKFKSIRKSYFYLLKFILFILISGFIAWIFNENNSTTTAWRIFLSGSAADALLNKGSEAFFSKDKLFAGEEYEVVTLRDIF